ncbi:unnamed protein product, partial [Closterium sp. NIES-65]
MDDNGEDCVYFGRALERAEGAGGRKLHLAVAEGRAKQAVPPWQQEARDDEGRRRFHGAFTGGFSAGYFNSVGSKEVGADAAVPSSAVPSPAVPLAAAVLLVSLLPQWSARRHEGRGDATPEGATAASLIPLLSPSTPKPPLFIPTPRVYLPPNPPRLSARQPPAFICPPTPRVYLPAPPPPAFICPPTPRVYLPANPPRLSARQPPAFICPPTPRVYLPANPSPSNPGWQPASFRSSRSQRAEVQPQRVEALMDADERHDAQRSAAAAHSAFDTFGFTAAERARHLAPAADRRPSVIPGGAVAELLAPAADSIGKALLRRMGWREGRGLGPDEVAASRKVQREGRRAMLALAAGGRGCGAGGGDEEGEAEGEEDGEEGDAWGGRGEIVGKGRGARGGKDGGPLAAAATAEAAVAAQLRAPKRDTRGVGFDAFQGAEDVREHRQRTAGGAREGGERGGERGLGGGACRGGERGLGGRRRAGGGRQSLFAAGSGRVAGGFGIGALEEAGAEDEDIYDSALLLAFLLHSALFFMRTALTPLPSPPVRPPSPCALPPRAPSPPVRPLPPCALSPRAPSPPVRPPEIPAGELHEVASHEGEEGEGRGVHAGGGFMAAGRRGQQGGQQGAQGGAQQGMAWMGGVGRGSGAAVLRGFCEGRRPCAREEGGGEGSARLAFLVGGEGSAYYRRRVWELAERQRAAQGRAAAGKAVGSSGGEHLGPDARGALLGERPLPSSQPAPAPRLSAHPTPTSTASPAAAASAFTSAASPAAPPAPTVPAFQQHGAAAELAAMMAARFHSSGHEDRAGKGGMSTEKAALPAAPGADTALAGAAAVVVARRREEAWRPLPLLCKRFNLPDPYAGKAPPPHLHRPSQLDTLTSFPQTLPSTTPAPTAAPS